MKAWTRHGRPEKAEEWLGRLESWQTSDGGLLLGVRKLRPNTVLYTIVLSGWAKVGDASRSLGILQRQLDSYAAGNSECQPDTMTFNCALDALAKSKDRSSGGWIPKEASRIAEEMKQCR